MEGVCSLVPIPLGMVIGFTSQNREGTIELLEEYDTYELMGERESRQGEALTVCFFHGITDAVSPPHDKCHLRGAMA